MEQNRSPVLMNITALPEEPTFGSQNWSTLENCFLRKMPVWGVPCSVSRIVPKLAEGELVTIPRFWADTVVTEYGVANLLGKNHRERAYALISVAHPDFQKELQQSIKGWLIP